jgi:uracil-DNA glycosylase family 4
VTVRELARYCRDLGWRDAPALPETSSAHLTDAPVGADDLEGLCHRLDGCTRCRLSETRRTIVFGEGHPRSTIMFIGEGPGAEEDRTGRPFVGQAGQLLDEMIFALGFDRAEVYIGNVVKCRPPGNRDPQEDEMASCSEFLDRQIELIAPQVLVTLGRVAARRLTGLDKAMGALRGRWISYLGIPLMPIFHPAYLLRNESAKRSVWQDLKKIRERLDENS